MIITIMPFNHYAKIKRILSIEQTDWVIKLIDSPTKAKNFKGETIEYSHYYRIYRSDGSAVAYAKFQKIDLFAKTMGIPIEELPII